MQVSDRIFHISHNDLDGYACQFAVSRVFYNVAYYNGNYHELEGIISSVFKQIKMEILAAKPPRLLLITDINLSLAMAEQIQKQIQALPVPVKLQLLDHHITGQNCANQYPWYHLDTDCCATRLTYQWLKPWLTEELNSYLDELSSLVNVTDLWLREDSRFNMANLMADMIFDKPLMIAEMEEEHRNYLFYHIFRFFQALQQGASVEQIERQFYNIRLDFLKQAGLSEGLVNDTNISLENKYHALILNYLVKHKPTVIAIDDYKTALFFRWNGTLFQHISSQFLEANPDIDIAMRVGSNARLSIRCHNQAINVAKLSQRYFNGGGHPQAAGGFLKVREIKNLQSAIKHIQAAILAAS